jgi:hypothetical protein
MPTPLTYNVNVCWNSSTALAKPGPVDPNVAFVLAASGTTTAHPHGEFVVNEGDSISFTPDDQCPGYKPFRISLDPQREDTGDVVAWLQNPQAPDGSVGATITLKKFKLGHEVLAYMQFARTGDSYSVASGKPVIRNGPFAGITGTGSGPFLGLDPMCWLILALLLASLGYIGWSKLKNAQG